MAVKQVVFYAADNDRPFGIYADEESFVAVMDCVIAKFDEINAKEDKSDADWALWRILKDTQFKMTATHYKFQRGLTVSEPLQSGFDVDTNDPNLAAF